MFSFLNRSKTHRVTIEGRAEPLEADAGKTLLETMLAQGLAMPHDCKVGSCGTCRFRLLEGKIKELSPSALALEREDLQKGFRLACQAMPRTDLTIAVDEVLEAATPVETREATIVATPRLCADIIGLSIETESPVTFTPGQYADLTAPGVNGSRSYSFAFSAGSEATRHLHFHIRHVPGGAFTDWLFGGDRIGSRLELTGSFGQFRLKRSEAPMLCVAGGSGLAPILSILQQAQAEGANRPVRLLYGARTQAHLYCLDQIAALQHKWRAEFIFIPVLSEEDRSSNWQGARGMVTDPLRDLAAASGTEAYLCGPPAMVDLAENFLLKSGFAPEAIAVDRFLDRFRRG